MAHMEIFTELGLLGLFVAAFLSATIVPLRAEVVLAALLLHGASPTPLIIIATIGNVLGSLTNYGLGYWASLAVVRKWLNMSEKEFLAAEQRFTTYGTASLLLAWIPIIGDPLTVMAGILRIRLLWFLLLVTAGKLIRYIIITALTLQVS